ncbi:ribose-phosphate diphosphokinase [bacterium]|nr:ribose-phosphate diphosphokinase [bacterium]
MILSYPQNYPLSQNLSQLTGNNLVNWKIHTFPDGENLVTLPDNIPEKIYLVCDLSHPNSKILDLLFLSDALKLNGASHITLVAPYLPYMRQDTVFHKGELVTSKAFAKLISSYFDKLITIDAHLHRFKKLEEIYSIPCINLEAATLIGKWIKNNVKNPLIVGPDAESLQWVEKASKEAQAPFVVCEKNRLGDNEVKITISGLDAYKNLNPVLVDDIISSAHTLIEASRVLKNAGFKKVGAVATHALFSENAFQLCISEQITPLVTANTIAHSTNEVNVASLIPI